MRERVVFGLFGLWLLGDPSGSWEKSAGPMAAAATDLIPAG